MPVTRWKKFRVASGAPDMVRPATVHVAFYSLIASTGVTVIQGVTSLGTLTERGIDLVTAAMLLAFPACLVIAVPALSAWLIWRGTRTAPLLPILLLAVAPYFVFASAFEWSTLLQLALAIVATVTTLTPSARGFARAATILRGRDALGARGSR